MVLAGINFLKKAVSKTVSHDLVPNPMGNIEFYLKTIEATQHLYLVRVLDL